MHGATQPVPVRFTGDAREYFGIWIVNVLLSIATLGIYSAWAKVRNKQYFLGNTSIGGRPFGYHATGRQILVGRAIAGAGFAVMSIMPSIDPAFAGGSAGVALVCIPALICQALVFNASVTSWSNIRFRFEGSMWRAVRVFGIYPFLAAFTLFLAFPFVARATKRYIIGGHSLGRHRLSFDGGIGPFYGALLLSAAWAAAVLAISFSLYLAAWYAFGLARVDRIESAAQDVGAVIFGGVILIAVLPLKTIYGAFVRNAVYAGTTLEGGHRFASTISATRLVWMAIGNAVAIVVSCGMLLPWARIRVARYLCANTWVRPAGSLDQFVGAAESRRSALGDAYADIGGADVGAAA
ncbi:MAG: YjgN family protein [Defluviicoccus sp.]|nr:YjgN family protein [Defluviicoccus sp.]MDE0383755.1 YjgN family protein [Defluviicoccus sp.]